MRERLVAFFVVIAAVVVVAFGVTRAYYVGNLVQEQEQRKVERSVVLLAALVDERLVNGEQLVPAHFARFLNEAEKMEYDGPGARHMEALGPGRHEPPSDNDLVAKARVPSGGIVTLTRSGYLLRERINDALTPLVGLGITLIAFAALAAYLAARRIARPFQILARAAAQLGRGRFDIQVPHFSTPEAEQLGRTLESSAAQLHDLVRSEREFAINASHELRTPITALRLELEDLSMWPETSPAVAEQLQRSLRELDRLSGTVTHLLDLARQQQFGSPFETDVSVLVEEAVARWQPGAERAGREITAVTPGPVVVHRPPGQIDQVVDVLIENSLRHGAGRITVESARLEGHVRVRVRDEGSPDFGPEVLERRASRADSDGQVRGLSVACEVAEAMSGRLTLEQAPTTTFSLMLPVT